MRKVIVVGGGAAGVFAAIKAAEHAQVILLEKTRHLLAKVRISGGGRCNVTHACFDPKELIAYYPRGQKELLGPFFRFQPKDTMAWFEARGVALKTEADGRIFPTTDSSDTIIRCLFDAAREAGVDIRLEQRISEVKKVEDRFFLTLEDGKMLEADRLLLATGSSPQGEEWAAQFGHTIIPPVPSLFTFNVPTSPLSDLAGISLPSATVRLPAYGMQQLGPLLITHWGFSGPAVLKLSSHAAKELYQDRYKTSLQIQWVPNPLPKLLSLKQHRPAQCLETENPFGLPQNLWKRLIHLAGIPEKTPLSRLSNASLKGLANLCSAHPFTIEGKTTYKHEFVTCGGVELREVDFRTMESRRVSGLYFAGEILNIDGLTGGFNLQNAWTSGWIAGSSMAQHN